MASRKKAQEFVQVLESASYFAHLTKSYAVSMTEDPEMPSEVKEAWSRVYQSFFELIKKDCLEFLVKHFAKIYTDDELDELGKIAARFDSQRLMSLIFEIHGRFLVHLTICEGDYQDDLDRLISAERVLKEVSVD